MKTGILLSALLLACCLWPCMAPAQTSAAGHPASAVAEAETYPDQAYLSSGRYSNRYFGFTFEFPSEARLQPQSRPVSSDGHAQLLEVDGPAPEHAQITISAYRIQGKGEIDAKQLLRRQLDQELFYGVEELRGLSKINIDRHVFHIYMTRRGVDEHALLASDINGYVLEVALGARDDQMLKRLLTSFQAARFFDPAQASAYAGSDARPYEGPALSAHRLAQLVADPPKNHIAAGTFVADQYRNAELGLVYQLPSRWHVGSQPGIEAAVERAHPPTKFNLDGIGDPWMGHAERELLHACNRTLFSAWKSKPTDAGEISYEDFGEITLSAMSLACFPDLNFPKNVANVGEIRAFMRQFRLTHPLLDQMRDAKAFDNGGHIFVLTEGVIAFQNKDDALSRRVSLAYAVTQHEGYLLIWLFAAPHDSELRELMNASMTLTPERTSKPASDVAAGGAAASAQAAGHLENSSDVQPSAGAQPQSTAAASAPNTASGAPAEASSENSPPTASPASQPSSSGSPSLLKPGETMNDQQMKGTPVPKKH